MYSTMFADELHDNVAITVNGNCSTHPRIENGTMQVHATESDGHMVEGKSVGNEKERARQLLGGRLLHRYQRQPWNSWSSKLDTHGMGNNILSKSCGHRLMRKQAAKQGREDASDKKIAPGSSV